MELSSAKSNRRWARHIGSLDKEGLGDGLRIVAGLCTGSLSFWAEMWWKGLTDEQQAKRRLENETYLQRRRIAELEEREANAKNFKDRRGWC